MLYAWLYVVAPRFRETSRPYYNLHVRVEKYNIIARTYASEMHPDPPHTTGTPSVDRGCSGCPRCIPIDRPRHACVAAALAIFNF